MKEKDKSKPEGFVRTRFMKKAAGVALLSCFAALALSFANVLTNAEFASIDARFMHLSHPDKADTNIVIIAIDQGSLDAFEQEKIGWPFPREFYAVTLDFLKRCGARAVVFDIDFSSTETDRLDSESEESERLFAAALKNFGNAYLCSILREGNPADANGSSGGESVYTSVLLPKESLKNSAAGAGFTNVLPDEDKIIRRVPFVYTVNGAQQQFLSYQVYMDLHQKAGGDHSIPGLEKNQYMINWYGRGGIDRVFRYYPIHAVIVSGYRAEQNLEPLIHYGTFKDKIVFIGGTAPGLSDYKPVPVSADNQFPGVEVHAAVLSNFLNRDYIYQVSDTAAVLITLLFCFMAAYIMFALPTNQNLLLQSVLLISYLCLAGYIFFSAGTILPAAMPLAGFTAALLLSGISKFNSEERQKREIRKLFSRYVNKKIIDELVQEPDKIDLKGKEIEATVFFSDIKDFTSISEKLTPQEIVRHLNEYFSLCSDVIMKYSGMIDKYSGDSVMAVFGAPVQRENHALDACLCALEIIERLKEFNINNQASGAPQFYTRIGIHTGRMVIGNIGTEYHLDYTVIGDTVNLASRLESSNKIYNTAILISENTAEFAGNAVHTRKLDSIQVKGRETPVTVYELLKKNSSVSDGNKS